jgi:hypothetical protein
MGLPDSFLHPGRQVRVHAGGSDLAGTVLSVHNGWLRLHLTEGEALVNLATIAWCCSSERSELQPTEDLPVAREKETPLRTSTRVPGRPWSDSDIRRAVNLFLEGRNDSEVAEQHLRTRHQITVLRQAWESSRGNIPDDQISPAAQAWIPRLRTVLASG